MRQAGAKTVELVGKSRQLGPRGVEAGNVPHEVS